METKIRLWINLSLSSPCMSGSRTTANIIGPKEKSILDRCVERVYSKKRQYEIPTFFTLRRVLQEQDEPEAKDLALMLELFYRRYFEQFFPSYQH